MSDFKLDLSKLPAAAEVASNATKNLDDWAKKAKKLAEEGKALNDIQDVLKEVEIFGKASFVLGIFASGLDFIIQMTGGPSPEEQIMKMVSQVSDQINSFSKHMDDRLDKLQAFVGYDDARMEIGKAASDLDSLRANINLYYKAIQSSADTTDIENRLLEFQRKDIQKDIQLMANLCTGASLVPDVLQRSYDYYHGNLKDIFSFGNAVLNHMVFGLIADGVLSNILYKRNSSSQAEHHQLVEEASTNALSFYTPLIQHVQAALKIQMDRCVKNATSNLILKSEKEFFPKLTLGDYSAASKDLTDNLQKQWFWLDFVAIVYDPVRGYQNHTYMSVGVHKVDNQWMGNNSESTLSYPPEKLSNIDANVFIYWNDRHAAVHKETITNLAKAISNLTYAASLTIRGQDYFIQKKINPKPFMEEFLGSPVGPAPAAIWAAAPNSFDVMYHKKPDDGVNYGYHSTNPDRVSLYQTKSNSFPPNYKLPDNLAYVVIYMS